MENMIDQITIFDILPKEDLERDINDLPENEMVDIVGRTTGLNFKYDDYLTQYVAKKGELTFTLKYSNYRIDDQRRFISSGWSRKMLEGAGIPADSIEEAVEFFNSAKERFL